MTDPKDEITDLRAEIAAQKAKVEALERALSGKEDKPEPKKEFVPAPYQRYDPTEGMCMPPSALRAMVAAEPKGFMSGVVRDNRAPTNPGSTIPSGKVSNAQPAERGTGWVDPRPLGPPPGIRHVDAQMIADEVRQRAELKRKLGG